MSEIELPSQLIAAGEELWGDKVNVYQKTEIIKVLADARVVDQECKVSVTAQSGLMTLFFIQAHACGGLDAVKELDVTNLEYESKRLVGSLIEHSLDW